MSLMIANETAHATVLKVPLIHGQFSKCGHAVLRCFTGHVPASLLPELFSKLTGIFFNSGNLTVGTYLAYLRHREMLIA